MTVRVPIRQLQQRAGRLVDQLDHEKTIEVTRNGRLVAIMSAPNTVQSTIERLVAEGLLDPNQIVTIDGRPSPALDLGLGDVSLGDTIIAMREEEDR